MTAHAIRENGFGDVAANRRTPEPAFELSYFPYGAEDERIDSRLARFHIQEGHRGIDTTYRRIFNCPPFFLGMPVPSRLDRLAAKLPGDVAENIEDLYCRSTLFPLYQQFGGCRVHAEDRATLYSAISNNTRWKQNVPDMSQLCPACLAEDEEEFGWPIIRRSHNIPGVSTCWRHKILLISKCGYCGCPIQPPHGFSLSPWRGCASCHRSMAHLIASDKMVPEIEIRYAQFTKALLEAAPIPVSSDKLRKLYRYQAISAGYSRKTLVDRVPLLQDIEETFGAEMLHRIDPQFESAKNENSWFHVLQSQCDEAPMARHIMLSLVLFGDGPTFIKQLRLLATGKLDKLIEPKRGAGKKLRKLATVRSDARDDLMVELAALAVGSKLDIAGLWKHRYGKMRRLFKGDPDAVYRLQNMIATGQDGTSSKKSGEVPRRKERNHADAEWAAKVQGIAKEIYSSKERPFRVTVNMLKKRAKFVRTIDAESFPATQAALVTWAETTWHFYARRLIWAARGLRDKNPTPSKMIVGVDYYRMREVYNYFEPSLRAYANIDTPICELLSALEITRAWEGPCPDKVIQRTGRAYYTQRDAGK